MKTLALELMKTLTLSLFLVGITLAVIFSPFILIWSLNTLFPTLMIPYTWKTYVASLVFFPLIYFKIKQ